MAVKNARIARTVVCIIEEYCPQVGAARIGTSRHVSFVYGHKKVPKFLPLKAQPTNEMQNMKVQRRLSQQTSFSSWDRWKGNRRARSVKVYLSSKNSSRPGNLWNDWAVRERFHQVIFFWNIAGTARMLSMSFWSWEVVGAHACVTW